MLQFLLDSGFTQTDKQAAEKPVNESKTLSVLVYADKGVWYVALSYDSPKIVWGVGLQPKTVTPEYVTALVKVLSGELP